MTNSALADARASDTLAARRFCGDVPLSVYNQNQFLIHFDNRSLNGLLAQEKG